MPKSSQTYHLGLFTFAMITVFKNRERLFKANGYHSKVKKMLFSVAGGLGIITILFMEFVTFFNPENASPGFEIYYAAGMISGIIVIISIPLLTYAIRNPEWKIKDQT